MNQYLTEQSILYLQRLKQPQSEPVEIRRKGLPAIFRRWIAAMQRSVIRLHVKPSARGGKPLASKTG